MLAMYVLGAGFSRPAGLPLGPELFRELVAAAKAIGLYEHTLKPDLDRYLSFVRRTSREPLARRHVNFEQFMSFLDVEHSLRLTGSDTWTDQGNQTQLVTRNLIAKVLYRQQWHMTAESLQLYDEFVRLLDSGDIVITFNYDTILEDALDRVGKKYRLFPARYSQLDPDLGVTDDDEIVILKMHGSIDWFDRSGYNKQCAAWRQKGYPGVPPDDVFGLKGARLVPLIDGLYPPDSPLTSIYRLRDLNWYLTTSTFAHQAPVLISPSFSKLLYVNPVREFWYGFGATGRWAQKLAIIGFSLPEHDEYIKQALYSLVRNFQHARLGRAYGKCRLTLVDYRVSEAAIAQYRETYKFVAWKRSNVFLNGFGPNTLPLLSKSAG